jgi:hypothetical protein
VTPEEDKEGDSTSKAYFNIIGKFVKICTFCPQLKLEADYYNLKVPFVEYCFESLYKVMNDMWMNGWLYGEDMKIIKNILNNNIDIGRSKLGSR